MTRPRQFSCPARRIPRWRHRPCTITRRSTRAWSANSVGLLGGTVLGISSVAPAYALTATIGLVVAVAGVKMPIIFIAGFLPMFFAAYAYREFNQVDPDCGTSFTWTTRAFGPYVGWLGGWVGDPRDHHRAGQPRRHRRAVPLPAARQPVQQPGSRRSLGEQVRQRADLPGCSWSIATFVAYRGITTTEKVQFVLVFFQLAVLALFVVMAFAQGRRPGRSRAASRSPGTGSTRSPG